MPQLGETVAEGKITQMVQAGRRRRRSRATTCSRSRPTRRRWKCRRPPPACSPRSMSRSATSAQVGAVVAVIAGEGEARSGAQAPRRSSPPTSPVAPQSATQPDWSPRRGTSRAMRQLRRSRLDPFREVRTPGAQFRPGEDRRHHSHAAGAAARRRERHRSVAHLRLRPAWPHRRARRRVARSPGRAPRRARAATGASADRSRRSTATCRSRKSRSTACADHRARG